MRQYLDVKRQYRDAIVFFRMGDFYEMFYEDALAASRVLELTLTSRAKDASGGAIPMCGLPVPRGRCLRGAPRPQGLPRGDLRSGRGPAQGQRHRQARSDARGVPGTFTDASYLDAREPAFLAAVTCSRGEGRAWGLAYLDVSTGEFAAAEFAGPGGRQALRPSSRCCVRANPRGRRGRNRRRLEPARVATVTRVAEWSFEPAQARERLCEQLRGVAVAHGLEAAPAAVSAAGAIVLYLRETQKSDIAHVRDISHRVAADCLLIDPVTLRHLNVVEGVEGGHDGSLLNVLDRTPRRWADGCCGSG
jgi:DNA mismatch repair protein MutS